MADLSVGAEFAGCRIEAVAGRGGMGVLIYEVGGIRYLDQFVHLDCQDGYAVQGQAAASRFLELAPTFRRSANSLRSRPC